MQLKTNLEGLKEDWVGFWGYFEGRQRREKNPCLTRASNMKELKEAVMFLKEEGGRGRWKAEAFNRPFLT